MSDAIRRHEEASAFLAVPYDFDLDWSWHVEPAHLVSGMALEDFARDGAGGTYFSAVWAERGDRCCRRTPKEATRSWPWD